MLLVDINNLTGISQYGIMLAHKQEDYMVRIILLVLLVVSTKLYAEWWYLIDEQNRVVAKQDGPGKEENLKKDKLFAVKSDQDIDLYYAVYRNNEIVKRKKTDKEIAQDGKVVSDKKSAIDKLKAMNFTDDEISVLMGR
jgi:hypothetical protein